MRLWPALKFPALVLPALVPFALPAQAQDTGGMLLTFGIEARVETASNLGLEVPAEPRTTQGSTRLSFGFLTETPSQRLSFDASTALRAASGPNTGPAQTGLIDPRAALSYRQETASAAIVVTGSISEADIAFLRPLDDFVNEDGEIELPADLEDLTGTGLRRSQDLSAGIDWGTDRPLGMGLTASTSALTYRKAGPGLFDSRRDSLSARMRLSFSEVSEATLEASTSRFDDDAPLSPQRRTTSLELGLVHNRPDGSLSARLNRTRTEDGPRTTLSFGRSFDLPLGALSASLGATRGVTGKTGLTGALDYRHDGPDGSLSLGVSRAFQPGSDDTERQVTALRIGYSHALGAATTLGTTFSYVSSQETATGLGIDNGSLGVTLSHQLTPDWTLDTGLRHDLRDEDGVGRAKGNTLFLTLRRSFDTRF